MAIAQRRETNSEGGLTRPMSGSPGPTLTMTGQSNREERLSYFAPSFRRETEASALQPTEIFVSESPDVKATPQIPQSAGLKTIDAVVGDLLVDSVVIHCLIPSGNIDIRLPPSLIPSDLLVYGKPVRLSLSSQQGGRYPRVEAREIGPQPKFAGEDQLLDWVNSL
jgi:hypothetical protein